MQTGHARRLGAQGHAVATTEGHLTRDHRVELPRPRGREARLEFVRPRTTFLDRVEANPWSPRLMRRRPDKVTCLECRVTHL